MAEGRKDGKAEGRKDGVLVIRSLAPSIFPSFRLSVLGEKGRGRGLHQIDTAVRCFMAATGPVT